MVFQTVLHLKLVQPHQSVYLAELAFEKQETAVKREVNLLISFIFLFLSDNTVNSIETWWMCFHLCRMMPNVGFCSRSFSREITLIPGDTFIILCPVLFMVLL